MDSTTYRRVFAIVLVFVLVTFLRFNSGFSSTSVLGRATDSSPAARQNPMRQAARPPQRSRPTLDIVVGLDNEDLTETSQLLQELWAMPPFQYLETNIHVYVSDPEADIQRIKHVLDTPFVKILQNTNHETVTYLTHITTNWDHLATHTLFMTAADRDHQGAKGRITDYFGANTGVLPLSSIETHNCNEHPNVQGPSFTSFDDLFYQINGEFCRSEVAYTKQVQMIVSAARIRSREFKMYDFLLRALRSEHPHILYESKQSSFKNEESKLYFQKSVKKSYMMLWGCGEPGIVNNCGGTKGLATRRRVMDKDDYCQCIDFERTS
jgi:hypothetical protein